MSDVIQHKTKNQNTFRFKSFANRINDIDLRRLALYHIGHRNEELSEDEEETQFHQTLKKWMIMNLTEEFTQFSRKCLKVITLPQLIHQKDYVIDLLLEYLNKASNLSLQPLLELVYVLARDLREEFYQYFEQVLGCLISLLKTDDAEVLEWTLVCLAYLFKILKPFLKKNIGIVFHEILPLLDEQRYGEHVTNFAVECFSFIARDVKDYKKFLDFIIETTTKDHETNDNNSIQGCGRLLFEIMRGVKGQFHSVAGEFLEFIFRSLVDEKRKSLKTNLQLAEIVKHSVQDLLKFIHPSNMTAFWTKMCSVANELKTTKKLEYLLEIFLMAAAYHDGRYLTEMDVVVPTILKLMDMGLKANESGVLKMLTSLVAKIVLATSTQITQLDATRLIKKALLVKDRPIYDEFVLSIVAYAQFEYLVLPTVVIYFEQYFDLPALELLVRIVNSKRPMAKCSWEVAQWQVYPLHFKQISSFEKISDRLDAIDVADEKLEESLLLFVLAPHLPALRQENFERQLKKAIVKILDYLDECAKGDSIRHQHKKGGKQLAVLNLLLASSMQIGLKLELQHFVRSLSILMPLLHRDINALYSLDLLLGSNDACALNLSKAMKSHGVLEKELKDTLAPLLGSYKHQERLLAAHCLQLLDRPLPGRASAYGVFYAAEQVEPNVHNYREKLLHLQKLETAGELLKSLKDNEDFKCHVVHFLLGTLYQNFKFIWGPVQKLLEDYAKCMPVADFWAIYKRQLEFAKQCVDKACKAGKAEAAIIEETETEVQWKSSVLAELLLNDDKECELTPQAALNYRILLWTPIPRFGQLAEVKNRDLIAMFFSFLDDEYRKCFERREFTWNLTGESIHEEVADESGLDEDEADAENDAAEAANDNRALKGAKRTRKSVGRRMKSKDASLNKILLQTLQTKMQMFIGQPNPKALYRNDELHAFYMDLLAGPNAQLQKLALDCVLSYKVKALVDNKEPLNLLIDEQKFKDFLVSFKLESIDPSSRAELMPILLRLLYGKMITKGSQRGVSSQLRKSLILRFLGQCSVEEIFGFFRMAFGRYDRFCQDSVPLERIPNLVAQEFDINAVWSPKKLTNVVNLVELVRKEFGGLMTKDFHLYTLKLLIFVGSVSEQVLTFSRHSKAMHVKMPVVFRNVKNLALLSLVNFLAHIASYEWSPEHMYCFTSVFVLPSIEKLSLECIHTPTPLLKLILQWSQHRKLFTYLNQAVGGEGLNVLHYVIDLLLNEKAKPAVCKPILGLIERLLVLGAPESSEVLEDAVPEAEMNLGLELVKPFIPRILERIRMNVKRGHGRSSVVPKQGRQVLDKSDLGILTLLTPHVSEPETCEELLQLLLPALLGKATNAGEDVVMQVITTVSNLVKRLNEPQEYLVKLAPLFEHVSDVAARKSLCLLIADIAKNRLKKEKRSSKTMEGNEREIGEKLRNYARIVLLLNAWDKRWVEQPDYDKRLDAFKEINAMLATDTVDLDLGVLVIYNCCYFLRFDKDMGLRDNASEHLRHLLPCLVRRYAKDERQLNFLVNDIFMGLVRRLITDKNDNIRHEGIRLLGEMVRKCPEAHVVLSDLSPLADSQDDEADFFENLVHLQAQRHGKALQKLCSYFESLSTSQAPPNTRTLMQFFLPLVTRYLFQEKFAEKHTLIDTAIEALRVICQLLPWQHYHTILKFYLLKMRVTRDFQKQAVRIVVRILDAFHFDLRNAGEATTQDNLAQLRAKLLETPLTDGSKETAESEKKQELEKGKDTPVEPSSDQEHKEEGDEDDVDVDADEIECEIQEEEPEEEVARPESKKPESMLKQTIALPPKAASRIMATITSVLIPTLNRSITEKSNYDTQHKVNRKRLSFEREEDEILRVPIALALVKLMQKLPKELLDNGLPGVFMKVCTFLRSPLKSVRMLTRDMLKKIMLTLGSSYLPLLLEHLQSLLTRGFQVHVLSVTVHGVLDALRGSLQAGDVDKCLVNILDVTLNDIFGDIAAEKEVQKIASHTPEAKPSAKSYLILHIAARNIQETSLLDLLMPFKDHLARSHSRKLTFKIQECFAKIGSGLVENPRINRESLLIFIYGTVSESITDLLPGTQKRSLSEKEKEKMRRARPDCFLIQPVPKRRQGAVNKNVKTSAQTNAHILIEFGLDLLQIVLKRKKLVEIDYQPFLNPLLPLLRDALKSTHVRVTTFALKCLAAIWNNEYELPELVREYLGDIVARLFEILKNFSAFGSTKQEDNSQLVQTTFKAVVALLRNCPQYKFTAEQIDQLVLRVEQDLFESERQVISFSLLKAMIARKVNEGNIHKIIRQVADLSITSASDYVRDEARSILVTYIVEYPFSKHVDQIIKHLSVQLGYELPSGRQSAIQLMLAVIKKFPQDMLSKRSDFLFLSLAMRLVNDDEPECRKAVAECIELLLTRLEKADRNRLFEMTLVFFEEGDKPGLREMAASLCSRFVNVEKRSFSSRLKILLPTLVARLTLTEPNARGRFVRAPKTLGQDVDVEEVKRKRRKYKKFTRTDVKFKALDNTDEVSDEVVALKQRSIDHEVLQMQYCLFKILDQCASDIFTNPGIGCDINYLIDEIAYIAKMQLAHEHLWVRCNAAAIIGKILQNYDYAAVAFKLQYQGSSEAAPNSNGVKSEEERKVIFDYIYADPEQEIRSLILDLCAQVYPGETPQLMIDEIVKIFLLVANILKDVPFRAVKKEQDDVAEVGDNDDDAAGNTSINLYWLMRRIRFLINKEIAKAPHSTLVRTSFFTLMEAFMTLLDVPTMLQLSPSILSTLVREMSEDDQNIDKDLRQLALRVGSRLRKRIGAETYDKLRSSAQGKLMMRRADRKKLIAQEKIHDPTRAAKRKAAVQERKKISKKRKKDVMRGKAEDVKDKLKKRRKRKADGDIF